MSEQMASDSERSAPGDLFHELEATIKQLRAAATPPPAPPESWLKKTLSPAAPSSHQSEFNAAVVEALNQLAGVLRDTTASQEKCAAQLAQLADEVREWRRLAEDLDAVRAQADGVGSELRAVATNVRGLQERAAALEAETAQARGVQERIAALEAQLAQAREEQSDKVRQLSDQQGDLRREFQERIQHLLDEQRVCIRQLSLQASEEAVLVDRARRATELKLEELARRLPPPPA